MAEDRLPEPSGDRPLEFLHELAEGLQAATNYIEAALSAETDAGADPELLDKAARQLARAKEAYSRLHGCLVRAAGEGSAGE